MLLDVLSQERWRRRSIQVTFVGKGVHREALEGCANYLGLKNVTFTGHVENIEQVWRDHHALVLPSRAEGTPLAAIEALSCGRPCILSPAGGNRELLANSNAGVLAKSASVEGLSDAMEEFWERRSQAQEMGQSALGLAKSFLQVDSVSDFVNRCLQVSRAGTGPAKV
jgi:glycosyltransferase involved in cell wall biosynthesis